MAQSTYPLTLDTGQTGETHRKSAPGFGRGAVRLLRRFNLSTVVVIGALLFLIILPVGAFLIQGVSPRPFSQGTSWFTLGSLSQALSGATLRGFTDSIGVSAATSIIAFVLATGLAWLVSRTNVFGRRIWTLGIWALLLMPTYLMANGWQYLLEPAGVMQRLGLPLSFLYHLVFGPAGVVLVLTMAGLPFAYLTMLAAFNGLGQEFEDAAKVHGANRYQTVKAVLPILAPAVYSSLAIVFAESMSDFGVSFTLAHQSHFPMATFGLFAAIDTNPSNFGVAAILGWFLVLAAAIPIAIQARALRGRSYAVLSGRTRTPKRKELAPRARWGATACVSVLFIVALGIPIFGAVAASLLNNFGVGMSASHAFTLANYRQALTSSNFLSPILLSNRLSALTATFGVVLALFMAKMISSKGSSRFAKLVDLALLGSMALPGIVLAAGYIFAFNLPIASKLGVDFYETLPLLLMGYIATVLPSQSRLLMGPISQVKESLLEACRVHGHGIVKSWIKTVLPVLSRVLMWGWLYTFAKTLVELPVSQILYPPGNEPVSVAIENLTGNYHYAIGTALTVVTLIEMFGVIGIVLLAFRIFAPKGWQRIGGVTGAA